MPHGGWCPTFPWNLQLGLGSSGQGHGPTQDVAARVAREHGQQKGNLLGRDMGGRESHSRLQGPGDSCLGLGRGAAPNAVPTEGSVVLGALLTCSWRHHLTSGEHAAVQESPEWFLPLQKCNDLSFPQQWSGGGVLQETKMGLPACQPQGLNPNSPLSRPPRCLQTSTVAW